MKRSEAPAPGWYPDPVQRARLRWWDGSDWSDHRRVGPRPTDVLDPEDDAVANGAGSTKPTPARGRSVDLGAAARTAGRALPPAPGRSDASALVEEVRRATRGELDRATTRLTRQASDLRGQLEPLLQEYGRRFLRWARRVAVIAVAIYVLYVVATAQLQTSVFEWLGDQIDKVID